jgi:hypothetical protein
METFIVVNLKTGELLYFDYPINCIKTDKPKKPEDLIGYEPPNLADLKLIIYPGFLTLNEAKQKAMRYSDGKIIDQDQREYEVKVP